MTSPRKTSTKKSKVWLILWSIDSTGQDLKSHLSPTVPKLPSQPLSIKETVEIFLRRISTQKFKVWPTPWSIDLTGQDPRSLSFQTVPRLLSQLHPFINIIRTLKILPTRRSDQTSGLPFTRWSIQSPTGEETKLQSPPTKTGGEKVHHQCKSLRSQSAQKNSRSQSTQWPRN